MERITRDQLLADFGELGVQNPAVIDLITVDSGADCVVLVMTERRPWGAATQQLKQIEEKINRYLGYALDGFLVEHYPHYEGKSVRIRLDCAEPPRGEAVNFVEAATRAVKAQGMDFVVTLLPPPS